MRNCEVCCEKFAPKYFRNSSACRFCDSDRKYDDLKMKYDILEKQHESVKEFIAANIVVLHASDTAPSLPNPTKPTYAQVTRTLSAEAPDDGFIPVRSGARPSTPRKMLQLTTFNRFAILKEKVAKENETRSMRIP